VPPKFIDPLGLCPSEAVLPTSQDKFFKESQSGTNFQPLGSKNRTFLTKINHFGKKKPEKRHLVSREEWL
jgi:hypothetical protein